MGEESTDMVLCRMSVPTDCGLSAGVDGWGRTACGNTVVI